MTTPRIDMRRFGRGFTLVEAVVVIVITGILAGIVAIFIAKPMQGYADAARRADMTDIADTALRRIGRDLRLALPNSVRANGGTSIEFLATRSGGRYRAQDGGAGTDPLDFEAGSADTTFDLLGPAMTFQAWSLVNQNQIVIGNTGEGATDAYLANNNNRRAYNGVTGAAQANITITSTAPFPAPSERHRFQVVDTPVSYACAGGALWRFWGYAIQAAQPTLAQMQGWVVAGAAQQALLAQDVAACAFSYTNAVLESIGLVALQLTLQRSGETVTLLHQVHVTNVP